jgi:glycosyltransferase involved in cell wall biosynthesis
MPVYNGGKYFRLALRSALAQTHDNTEIIVVNDGSTDGGETDSIAREHAGQIKYIVQENRGVGGALNTGVANMSGDFFAWLSHDDLHLPHKTASQLNYFERLAKRDAILFSDYELIGPNNESIATARWSRAQFIKTPMLPLFRGMINGCTILIPRRILTEFGPFNERLRHAQDYDLWNRMLARYDFFHQPEVLVQYRLHPGQDSKKPDVAVECDALWIRMTEDRTEAEMVAMAGSSRCFLSELAQFLDETPYKGAAHYVHERARTVVAETLVSIVIPFYNECDLACRALRSVLGQSQPAIEVIMVDDGSTESLSQIESLIDEDKRVRLLRQPNAGPGAARNRGMKSARGCYIAFLDADDLFLPIKIQRQLELMQQSGSLVSHTSYYVRFPERGPELGLVDSGRFSGSVYPAIIGGCPISTTTVMLHRTLVSAGFEFPESYRVGEDVLAYIELARTHEILGIPEPLSIMEWSATSAAINLERSLFGLSNIVNALEQHQEHRIHTAQISALKSAIVEVAQRWGAAGAQPGVPALDHSVVGSVFGAL